MRPGAAPVIARSASMRYAGQGYEIRVSLPDGAIGEGYPATVLGEFHAAYLFGPGMRWCGLILKTSGSLAQASQTAWKGVRHRSALRCLAKL